MIEVEKFTKRFGQFTAVDDISFSVSPGEIVGLLGPNGAGKSTTFKVLSGYWTPTAGTCRLGGCDILKDPIQAKRQLGYLQESPVLYREMTALSYLHFVAAIKGIERHQRTTVIEEVIAACGLQAVLHKTIGAVSKGYRQRVALAQALLGRPPILLLDEPTSALDPLQVIEIRTLIRSLAKTTTILLSTHILSEATACCDRIMILAKGRLVTQDALATDSGLGRSETQIALKFSEFPESFGQVIGLGDKIVERKDHEVVVLCSDPVGFKTRLLKMCGEQQWSLAEMRDQRSSLEEIFAQLKDQTTRL